MPVYARKKGKLKKIFRLILLLMACAVAGRFVWSFIVKTELFDLKPENIIIEGNSMVSENAIMSQLNLKYGRNIFSYRLSDMELKLEKRDRIKTAQIKKNFPDGLYIHINEVNPVGYTFKDGLRCAVAESGNIFPGPEGPPVKFIKQDPECIRKLAGFFQELKEIDFDFYNSIIAVDLNYRGDIILHTNKHQMLWPPVKELSEHDIKRNINIYRSFVSREGGQGSLDFRFIEALQGEISGSLVYSP